MSGGMARDALQEHFDAVCREELDRLRRKLAGLTDDERSSAEMVIADVIGAMAKTSVERLSDEEPYRGTIDAIVHLFALDSPHHAR